jgi:hypothetical protein
MIFQQRLDIFGALLGARLEQHHPPWAAARPLGMEPDDAHWSGQPKDPTPVDENLVHHPVRQTGAGGLVDKRVAIETRKPIGCRKPEEAARIRDNVLNAGTCEPIRRTVTLERKLRACCAA